ncbi:MAG: DMT family transporter [Myxococcaceae bacterium]
MDKPIKGTILVALSGVFYGTIGYFGTILKEEGLSVSDLLLWRFLGSVLLLLFFVPSFLKERLSKTQWQTVILFFVLGALCYGLGTGLYFESSFMIGTGLAMVLFFTYPLLVVAYTAFMERRLPSFVTWLSLGLIIMGCCMIGLGDRAQINWVGIFLAVLSGMSYGAYILASKNRSGILSPLFSTFVVCLGCVAAFVTYILYTGQPFYVPREPRIIWNMFLFSSVGTVLPVLFLLQGVKYISATKTAIISVLEPVTVLLVGVLCLSEPVGFLQAIGAVVILSSALVIQVARD